MSYLITSSEFNYRSGKRTAEECTVCLVSRIFVIVSKIFYDLKRTKYMDNYHVYVQI
jgi:hypothetical protein